MWLAERLPSVKRWARASIVEVHAVVQLHAIVQTTYDVELDVAVSILFPET